MFKYDKNVTTITDILKAIERFPNRCAILTAITPMLRDIETDWHMEELLRAEVRALSKELIGYIERTNEFEKRYNKDDQYIRDLIKENNKLKKEVK